MSRGVKTTNQKPPYSPSIHIIIPNTINKVANPRFRYFASNWEVKYEANEPMTKQIEMMKAYVHFTQLSFPHLCFA